METRKSKVHLCKCCLTKNDLILVTNEKQRIISSFLNLSGKTAANTDDARICINCNSTLSCIDKFRQNLLRAHAILKNCKLKSTFLTSVTDESVNSAFDTILNWMNDVTVILKYLTDVKTEGLVSEKESEPESVHEDESFEALHEEEMFVGSVEGEAVKKEEMQVEALDDEIEVKFELFKESAESQSSEEDDNHDSEYTPEVEKKNETAVDNRRYTCDLCGKKYAIRRDLMYHMNVHSGEFSSEHDSKATTCFRFRYESLRVLNR